MKNFRSELKLYFKILKNYLFTHFSLMKLHLSTSKLPSTITISTSFLFIDASTKTNKEITIGLDQTFKINYLSLEIYNFLSKFLYCYTNTFF